MKYDNKVLLGILLSIVGSLAILALLVFFALNMKSDPFSEPHSEPMGAVGSQDDRGPRLLTSCEGAWFIRTFSKCHDARCQAG